MSITGSDYSQIEMHEVALKYANVLKLLAQQTTSKLENCVMVESGLTGKTVSPVDQLGTFATRTRTGRFQETHIVDIPRTRRWYEPVFKDGAYLIDNWDKIRMDVTPEDGVATSIMAAYKRDIDAEIMRAYYAANKTGKDASSTTAFDNNNVIAKTAANGDVLGKIDLAIAKLQQNDVDFENEEVFLVVPPAVERELKEAGYYVSIDYQNDKVLAGKKLTPYAGVNFIRYNFAYTNTGTEQSPVNVYKCPFFCKSGVALGKWLDFQTKVSERDDLSYAKQIYAAYAIGATRTEEKKCLSIEFAA